MLKRHIYLVGVFILFLYMSFAWGAGGIPRISVSPKSLNFGFLRVGGTSATKTITVKNKGNKDLAINSITISGVSQSEFIQTNNCSIVAAKSSCTVNVTFAPVSLFGRRSSILSISSNDLKRPIVNVEIAGQAPPPKISISQKSVNFGSLIEGNTSAPKIVRIKNTGVSDLTVSSVAVTGTDSSEFSQTNDCLTMGKGDACTIGVTFAPTSVGRKFGMINISSNDPRRPTLNVELVGNAKSSVGTLLNWHWRSPVPQGNELRDIAYGTGTFVAVGRAGTILTSTDGINWVARASGTAGDLVGVTYGNGIFVAVGYEFLSTGPNIRNIFLTSSDGVIWISRTLEAVYHINRITYGNNMFVAVGTVGAILTSPDGVNWTLRNSGVSYPFYGLTCGKDVFVVVSPYGGMLTSPDGVHWSPITGGPSLGFFGVTYENGVFVAVGSGIQTSLDGVNWTAINLQTADFLSSTAYGNGTFVAAGDHGIILTSLDGVTWAPSASGVTDYLSGITYGNGIFVAVGAHGVILSSSDGVDWFYPLYVT